MLVLVKLNLVDSIRIVEVGPRDGLQNESIAVETHQKLEFIRSLWTAGLKEIEATSFVSPKFVPQLADAEDLWQSLPVGPLYSALVPNEKGLSRGLEVGAGRIALFTAASESFTQHNIRMSIRESLERFKNIAQEFRAAKPSGWIRGYVSTIFQCPYEGQISPAAVFEVVTRLIEIGVDEISLGDTIGVGSPHEVRNLAKELESIANEGVMIAWHFHDTWGTGLANVQAALDLGYRSFDSSAGGLGGCPYAPGAGGNLATEDLVYLAQRQGFSTGVDLPKLALASLPLLKTLNRVPTSKAQQAVLAELESFQR